MLDTSIETVYRRQYSLGPGLVEGSTEFSVKQPPTVRHCPICVHEQCRSRQSLLRSRSDCDDPVVVPHSRAMGDEGESSFAQFCRLARLSPTPLLN